MTITDYATVRLGEVTEITVTSDLTPPVYFHWYVDGALRASTQTNVYSLHLAEGGMVRLEAIDTTDPDWDPVANAPAGYPARRSLWWVRSIATDIARYRIEQQKDGGGWTTLATIEYARWQWAQSYTTDRLDDLADYEWRVVPIDWATNEGTPLSLAAETIVRTPDAPNWAYSFDGGTSKVTFSEAA